MERVLIWRGGVRFYRPGDFIFDPGAGEFIGPRPPEGVDICIVDANVYSGQTVFSVAQQLRRSYRVVEYRGTTAIFNLWGERIKPEVPYPPAHQSPLVFVSGAAGCGKSAIATMIAAMAGGQRIKWAEFVQFPGAYGEAAARLEQHDPLVFARQAVETLRAIPVPIVLDGVKDFLVTQFIAYATGRPSILLFVQSPQWLRNFILRTRGDSDDRFSAKRDALFAPRLAALRQRALVLDTASNDHSEIVELLAIHGIRAEMPLTCPVLLNKPFILDLPEYLVLSARSAPSVSLRDIPAEWCFHRRYVERYPVPQPLQHWVCTVASAFRIMDDILDESPTRTIRDSSGTRSIPAAWVTDGAWVALMRATAMICAAARHPEAEKTGFHEMLRRVFAAVRVELKADREKRRLNADEYDATLDREIAFREWVARLSNYPVDQARLEAREAQIKNDQYARGLEAARIPV